LDQGKEYKKPCAEYEANPRLSGGAHQPEKNCGRHKEQEEVRERIEDHALHLCLPGDKARENGRS
jgi:hypothetical protein